MDIHSARVTVRESLMFSARLRLDEATVSGDEVVAIVEATLATVELEALSGDVVGEPGADGLSIEQRKRLTIAVELVANPSVIFMDEPTSGLDARAAAIVMRAVRNVSCRAALHCTAFCAASPCPDLDPLPTRLVARCCRLPTPSAPSWSPSTSPPWRSSRPLTSWC
jgi:ABC-type multidrug transport system fused ATPase/permease subunit